MSMPCPCCGCFLAFPHFGCPLCGGLAPTPGFEGPGEDAPARRPGGGLSYEWLRRLADVSPPPGGWWGEEDLFEDPPP